jgi:threonine/homoserine/homoserine lactone efflux protein
VFVAIGMTWLVIYVYIVSSVARSPRFQRIVEAISGAVLVALGARLAIDRG